MLEAGLLRCEHFEPRGVAIAQGFDSAVNHRPSLGKPRNRRGGWYYHEVNNNTMNVFFNSKASHMVNIVLCYTGASTKLVHHTLVCVH